VSDRPHLSSPQLQMFIPARELMKMDSSDADAVLNPVVAGVKVKENRVAYEKAEKLVKDNIEESKDPEYYAQYSTPTFKHLSNYNVPLEENNLYDDVKKRGVVKPVHIHIRTSDNSLELVDGHHRVAIAHDVDPSSEVPVFYSERNS